MKGKFKVGDKVRVLESYCEADIVGKVVTLTENMDDYSDDVEHFLVDVLDGDVFSDGIELVENTKDDVVNHPSHYKVGGVETIDFIEAKNLSYHIGNVVKYLSRADHKGNKLTDYKKALWYLQREIQNLEKNDK